MNGAPGRIRTLNRLTRIELLYPLSYGRIGAGDGIRTRDLRCGRTALSQLSYAREEKARTHLAMQRLAPREVGAPLEGGGLHGGGIARAGKHGGLGLGQLGAQFVAHQWPDLLHGVLARDLAADLGVEVLGAGTGRLAGHGEAVAQRQDAESK